MKIFIGLLLFFLCHQFSFAQQPDTVKAKVNNYEVKEDIVIIYYDLEGESDTEYKPILYLKLLNKPLKIELKNVSGDIEIGIHSGKNKRIEWQVEKEKGSLQKMGIELDDDVQFGVFAIVISRKEPTEQVTSRSNLMYWLGGGALVIGGGVAAILLSKKTAGTTPISTVLPDPMDLRNRIKCQ